MKHCLFLLFALACAPREILREAAPDGAYARFLEAETRLLNMTEPHGWVVSRHQDGTIEHTGDSLLWTGMALGVLTCQGGNAPKSALTEMLAAGKLFRHPAEPTRAVSLDGQLGFLWGVTKRHERCGDGAPLLQLYRPDNLGAFHVVLEKARYDLGIGPNPDPDSMRGLPTLVAGWAAAVVAKRAAAYRIHLGWLALSVLGDPGAGLCAVTARAGMPLINSFCGRDSLGPWIDAFEYNRYEYALQRAKWESEDGSGLETPGLDLLVALRTAYNFNEE